jgi:hypothetical protein
MQVMVTFAYGLNVKIAVLAVARAGITATLDTQ